MRKILITGGAGFIGSHLAERYVADGADVVVVDDLSTGRLENLAPIEASPSLRVVVADVRDEERMAQLLADRDLVFHMAARIGLKLVIQSPLTTLETNVDGTASVLRAARAAKAKIVVASTSEVYGLASRIPSAEEDPITIGAPTKGRWSYAASKALDEFMALASWHEYGVPTVVVRLFNTVGPRQTGRYGMVIPRFVDQALAGRPLTVYGDGTQTRCFCHVHDVVGALVRLADEPSAVGEVFNLGNPQETTINALAAQVIAVTGSSSMPVHVPFEEAYERHFEEIMRRVPDIAKIRERIGFAPQRDLEAILRDVVADRAPVSV
ncbi:MAG TPA: SDR family NAD(P)-dependent oxidoreductase [Candidatus Limnocylindria bacterium]|nr:SDR family NAD(P)-dependent oxidoreductase [Candidatus Limnocylindria bacterium]